MKNSSILSLIPTGYLLVTIAWLSILVGVLLVGLWGGYWALSLRQDGYLGTTKVIALKKAEKNGENDSLVLVRTINKDNRGGREWEHEYASVDPLPVGAIKSYYLLVGPRVLRSDGESIPGDWFYPWLLPVLGLIISCVLVVSYISLMISVRSQSLMLITLLVIFVGGVLISADSFQRTLQIREYVVAQRLNDQALRQSSP